MPLARSLAPSPSPAIAVASALQQIVERTVAGMEIAEHPVGAFALEETGFERVLQASAGERGLAATGTAGHAQKVGRGQLLDHAGDVVVAAEEDVALVFAE